MSRMSYFWGPLGYMCPLQRSFSSLNAEWIFCYFFFHLMYVYCDISMMLASLLLLRIVPGV